MRTPLAELIVHNYFAVVTFKGIDSFGGINNVFRGYTFVISVDIGTVGALVGFRRPEI